MGGTEITPGITGMRDHAASLIGWWKDAGLDVLIDEAPRDWLAEVKPTAKRVAPAEFVPARGESTPLSKPVPASAGAPLVLPDTLPDFTAWLATDTAVLAAYPPRQRVAPQGDPASGIMIVTDVPERGDAEAGTLLTGEAGALFDKMLAAWKVERSGIYLTAVAPARPGGALMDKAALDLLTPVLARHIALVAPKKLWLVGEAPSRAVLGMNVDAARGRLHLVNYGDTKVEAIATLHPRVLVANPKLKGQVWADMQRLIGDTTA